MVYRHSPLIAIITGLEHSGTTYLSRLITSYHPKINTGFECGVLLADSPHEFPKIKPFYDWMQQDIENGYNGWGIRSNDMVDICSARSWEEMYCKIVQFSPIFTDKASYILDKNPRYMPRLDKILEKIDVPCIVIYKDIFFQYLSYKKRVTNLNRFISRYALYMNGLAKALKKFRNRIFLVKYEDLYEDKDKICDIFNFLGLEFETQLLSKQNALFKNDRFQEKLRFNFEYAKEIDEIKRLTQEECNVLSAMAKHSSLEDGFTQDAVMSNETQGIVLEIVKFTDNKCVLFSIDRPALQAKFNGNFLRIGGWVFGFSTPVTEIEVMDGHSDDIILKTDLNRLRPDVANHFQNVTYAGQSGFVVSVPLIGTSIQVDLHLRAVLPNGNCILFSIIRLKRKYL